MKKILVLILPYAAISFLWRMKQQLDEIVIRLFSKNGFLASFYFTFFSKRFFREHRAVLLGRVEYQKSIHQVGSSSALLRRNIHRIEKGLIMEPRREIFAEKYIRETVDHFLDAAESHELCKSEKSWAADVLSKYFTVVGSSISIDKAREKFVQSALGSEAPSSVPYPHESLPECSISYDNLFSLFQRRRSVRWFQDKEVDTDLIRQAVNAATLAPSACNRQPYRFKVVTSPEMAVDLAKCAMGTAGFVHNIPCVIAVVGDLSAYPAERDRHLIYIDSSLAAMQFMLALQTLGLASCPLNWPDVEEREVLIGSKLDLNYHERVVMLMAVGYPRSNGGIPFSQKKGDESLMEEVF